jgi:hypothetical protein
MAKEPCIGCGEETAVGSIFYSDRHPIDQADGRRTHLCTLCDARIRSSGRGRRLTDDQVRSLIANGSMAFIAWAGGSARG